MSPELFIQVPTADLTERCVLCPRNFCPRNFQDLIGLDGLTFGDLSIGQAGDDATISSNGELLAVLIGVDSSTLTEPDFVFIA